MGCASSKRIDTVVAADVYKPLPSSFAVFDINSIQEPWLLTSTAGEEPDEPEKPPPPPPSSAGDKLPTPLLEKISKFETPAADDAPPRSWDEVSKALATTDYFTPKKPPPPPATSATQSPPPPKKSASFHTLEELDAKLKPPTPEKTVPTTTNTREISLRNTEPARADSTPERFSGGGGETAGGKLKDNPFIARDRAEQEKEGKMAAYDRMMSYKRDPLAGFPENCPPGGESSLVVYTTSLRGVRRTHEDCARVRSILEGHRVVFDERDVSLDAGFLGELRVLLGSGAGVPRVFLKGRDLGGVDEVVDLNETGRLGRMLGWAKVERGLGWRACEGCGGARFVPCLACGGSCKVVAKGGGARERCGACNENGLVRCPACL